MKKDRETKQNLSNTVYLDLKERIKELRLPPNSVLLERTLSDALGTSRTPVREALKRLAQDGWVILQDRKRAVVRDISVKDVQEVFMLREMVEIFSINTIFSSEEPRLIAGLLVPVLNAMKKNIDDPITFNREDMKFHSIIVEHLKNERLNQIWDRIRDEITRIALYSVHENRHPESIIAEHENLIDGFWERNCEKTVTSMKDHYEMILKAYSMKFDNQENSDGSAKKE
ncbi:GntR family transcriptional regulator [bacterium]|nr:GntR family transcriptional regulator [bacterium]